MLNSISKLTKRNIRTLPMIIDGQEIRSETRQLIPIYNSYTNELMAKVPECTFEEIQKAIASSNKAFKSWSKTSVGLRSHITKQYVDLIESNAVELANIASSELPKDLWYDSELQYPSNKAIQQGIKNIANAKMIADKCIEYYTNEKKRSIEPVGIYAGVAALYFPSTISTCIYPTGTICGNTYIHKSSEFLPLTCMKLIELAQEAGFPPGVINLVHGKKNSVDFLYSNKEIKSIVFSDNWQNRDGDWRNRDCINRLYARNCKVYGIYENENNTMMYTGRSSGLPFPVWNPSIKF